MIEIFIVFIGIAILIASIGILLSLFRISKSLNIQSSATGTSPSAHTEIHGREVIKVKDLVYFLPKYLKTLVSDFYKLPFSHFLFNKVIAFAIGLLRDVIIILAVMGASFVGIYYFLFYAEGKESLTYAEIIIVIAFGVLVRKGVRPLLVKKWPYFREKLSAPYILAFMALLITCAFLLVFKLEPVAEQVANVAYFLLVVGVGIEVYQMVKNKERRKQNEHEFEK